MLVVVDKLEHPVKAALIVRDAEGHILEDVTSPVEVDPATVLNEVRRLRRQFGRSVNIDSTMIVRAREALMRIGIIPGSDPFTT